LVRIEAETAGFRLFVAPMRRFDHIEGLRGGVGQELRANGPVTARSPLCVHPRIEKFFLDEKWQDADPPRRT
jgi:hypothetical protein